MSIIAKNITASGIELPDLAGLYIGPYEEVDLREFFTIDTINNSNNLDYWIEQDVILMNNGIRDLTKEESLEHTYVQTAFEAVNYFLDLKDTPSTYSGVEYIFLKVNDNKDGVEFTSIEFQDLNDVPTYSGFDSRIPRVKSDTSGIEFVTVEDVFGNFGTVHSNAYDGLESSTNSTSYIQKLRLNLPGIVSGVYRIGWYYEWSMSNSSFRFDGKTELDGSSVLGVIFERPPCGYSWSVCSGFSYQNLLDGDHYIDIFYRSSHTSKSASIRRARLEIWRIS